MGMNTLHCLHCHKSFIGDDGDESTANRYCGFECSKDAICKGCIHIGQCLQTVKFVFDCASQIDERNWNKELEAEHEAETKLLNMLGTGKAREKLIEHIKTDTLENMVNFPEHVYENIFSKF